MIDGRAGGFQYVRVTPCGEPEGTAARVKRTFRLPRPGSCTLWLRVKGRGAWRVSAGGDEIGQVKARGDRWHWSRLRRRVEGGKAVEIEIASSDELLALDRMVLTTDRRFSPRAAEPRDTTAPEKPGDFPRSSSTTAG